MLITLLTASLFLLNLSCPYNQPISQIDSPFALSFCFPCGPDVLYVVIIFPPHYSECFSKMPFMLNSYSDLLIFLLK